MDGIKKFFMAFINAAVGSGVITKEQAEELNKIISSFDGESPKIPMMDKILCR